MLNAYFLSPIYRIIIRIMLTAKARRLPPFGHEWWENILEAVHFCLPKNVSLYSEMKLSLVETVSIGWVVVVILKRGGSKVVNLRVLCEMF